LFGLPPLLPSDRMLIARYHEASRGDDGKAGAGGGSAGGQQLRLDVV